MKNYVKRAKANGAHIFTTILDDKNISKYRLVHDNKYVEIERRNLHFQLRK